MAILRYKYQDVWYDLVVSGSGGPDEVAIGTAPPPEITDLWVDTDDHTGTGVVDHGILLGLENDDHPQYAKVTYVDQIITVSTESPSGVVPARDGLLWIKVPA